MPAQLFMFVADAIAEEGSEYRRGARHALMLFATGASIEDARDSAILGAESAGWSFVRVQRGKGIDSPNFEDEVLRSSAEHALSTGSALIVYRDELPHNS
jgi:hypothetical protein